MQARFPGCQQLALALIFLAAPLPSCEEPSLDPLALAQDFKAIHQKIYDVYELTDPHAVFDLLTLSLEGRELEKQVFHYLKCLQVQDRFNTAVSIAEVIYNQVEVVRSEAENASIFCQWVVIGKVRHPTHIHRKTNLNEALYRVKRSETGLRIVGYDLITQQALEVSKG